MIRSDLIATFVEIVRQGSLNGAARALRLSRSVISDRLATLEADIGAALIIRSTTGMSLTPEGETFLDHAIKILADMEVARAAVGSPHGAISGRLRVATPTALASEWLTPLFASFMRAHPNVVLEISAADRTIDIVSEGFDLAIRSARHPDSDLLAKRLTTGRRVIVCSPEFAAQNTLPSSIHDLAGHRFAVYRNRRPTADWTFNTDHGTASAKPVGVFEADDGPVLRRAVIEGVGICLLPTFIVSAALCAGELRIVDLGHEPEADDISAIYPRTSASLPRLRALVAHLKNEIGDPPVWDQPLIEAGLLQGVGCRPVGITEQRERHLRDTPMRTSGR